VEQAAGLSDASPNDAASDRVAVPDALPDDGADVASDVSPAVDARIDSPEEIDAEPDVVSEDSSLDSPADSPSEGGCRLLSSTGPCGPITYTCLPPGLTLGQNMGCTEECGFGGLGCYVTAEDGGLYSVECLCGGGRFPAGLKLARETDRPESVGTVLAQNAALEAAAVRAFAQLARELDAHGAPASLVARTRRAARQEATHARLLRKEAGLRGCKPPRARSPRPAAIRSLRELAIENAVEGCCRESIGAALLELQSLTAPDARLRAVFARIASDEVEHAELAWDVHAWLATRIDAAACAEVRRAREAFLATCETHAPQLAGEVARSLGMPGAAQWRALVEKIRQGIGALAA
jgi:hypothetical protein